MRNHINNYINPILVTVGFLLFCIFSAAFHFSRSSINLTEAVILLSFLLTLCSAYGYSSAASRSFTVLCRGLSLLTLLYILLQYPTVPNPNAIFLGDYLTIYWLTAMLFCALGYFRPAFLLFPGCYLILIKIYAGHLTGFSYERVLDIFPLYQTIVLLCSIVLVEQIASYILAKKKKRQIIGQFADIRETSDATDVNQDGMFSRTEVYNLAVFLVVALHAAGYLFSGIEKIGLSGGVLSWLTQNELKNIFLAASINQQLLWQHFEWLHNGLVKWWTKDIAIVSTLFVLLAQLAAVLLFIDKRIAALVFILLDLLHFGILVLVGANFITWMFINIIFVASMYLLPAKYFGLKSVIASIAIMVVAQFGFAKFYRVPNLAWYDSRAINTMYLEILNKDNQFIRLPSQFFLFYSYPISHMSFGLPTEGEGHYLPTRTNGGTRDFDVLARSYNCDFEGKMADTQYTKFNASSFSNFITDYHLWYTDHIGNNISSLLNFYWHHFWSSISVMNNSTKQVDFEQAKGYRLTIQPTCFATSDSRITVQQLKPTYFFIDLE